MTELLKGTIDQREGLRSALEIVTTLKEVGAGVLQISNAELKGSIGVAWGRYVTGAQLASGETGRQALRVLLSVRQGKFQFDDTDGQPISELRQSLGIDLNGVVPYVPDELTLAVTPWLYETFEQDALLAEQSGAPGVDDPATEEADRALQSDIVTAPVPVFHLASQSGQTAGAAELKQADDLPLDPTLVRQAAREAAEFLSHDTRQAAHLRLEAGDQTRQAESEEDRTFETFQTTPTLEGNQSEPRQAEMALEPAGSIVDARQLQARFAEAALTAKQEPAAPPPPAEIFVAAQEPASTAKQVEGQVEEAASAPAVKFVKTTSEIFDELFDSHPMPAIDAGKPIASPETFQVFPPGEEPDVISMRKPPLSESAGERAASESALSRSSSGQLFDAAAIRAAAVAKLSAAQAEEAASAHTPLLSPLSKKLVASVWVVFFVVSCAGTLIFGQGAIERVKTVLHMNH